MANGNYKVRLSFNDDICEKTLVITDNTLNYKGEEFTPVHSQGVFGISLDSFIENLSAVPAEKVAALNA